MMQPRARLRPVTAHAMTPGMTVAARLTLIVLVGTGWMGGMTLLFQR